MVKCYHLKTSLFYQTKAGLSIGLEYFSRKSIFICMVCSVCFAALKAATKFHLDGPGLSRALDPLFDAV